MPNLPSDQLLPPPPGERRAALATLVATRGTSPKKEGAKMWVGEGGRLLGAVTIGGCVDARVIEASEAALAAGGPRRLVVRLGDEEAWELGLTCSGEVELLIEPLDLGGADPVVSAYAAAAEEVGAGRGAVTVAPLSGEPARLLVREDGSHTGTLGNPALDRAAVRRAAALLVGGASGVERLESGEGGALEAFFEVHAVPTTLVVVGGGAVAMPLVTLARGLGVRTVVVEGRPRFGSPERFPDADEVRVGIPSEIVEGMPLGPAAWLVLVAHDYKYDLPVLRVALGREVGYIGLLGSRRRGRAILDFLAEEGWDREALARVRVPVGLDIGARTAPEIALSVLAEAVAVRSGRPGTPLRERAE